MNLCQGRAATLPVLAAALAVGACGRSVSNSASSTTPPAIVVSVAPFNASVPIANGVQSFAAKLQNDTQNKGVTWSLSGAGCSGASCGTLTAVTATTVSYHAPTAVPSPAAVVLTATSVADMSKTATANITVTPAGQPIAVAISPLRGGIAIKQAVVLSATVTNDVGAQGVSWAASGGALSNSGPTAATFSAQAAGVFTITATSIADGTQSATATIGVTDLAGVLTYRDDQSRDGANLHEYALTPANVSTHFGKLFSCPADGAIYAQPLWVPQISIGGGMHNVIVVATQNDSVYAFDADASPCITYWHANLLDAAHGATSGEKPVPSGLTGNLVGGGFGDIIPAVGITGTPVIDASTSTIFVVAKSVSASNSTFYQRLHALTLAGGAESLGGPAVIAAMGFSPQTENQRAGLALSGGAVTISWAAHEDAGTYHGWMMSYSATYAFAAARVQRHAERLGRRHLDVGRRARGRCSRQSLCNHRQRHVRRHRQFWRQLLENDGRPRDRRLVHAQR